MNPYHLTETNEHYTPPDIIAAAIATMGHIDLDTASCELANRYIKADQYFSKEMDGLNREWYGNVFLNPPGGICHDKSTIARYGVKSSQAVWAEKLLEEWTDNRVKQAIFVAFNLEISRYCQWLDNFPFCRPYKRIKYCSIDPMTNELRSGQWSNTQQKWTDASPHATIIFYLPPKEDSEQAIALFKKAFMDIGCCRNGYNYLISSIC
jgi:hypothetical protein